MASGTRSGSQPVQPPMENPEGYLNRFSSAIRAKRTMTTLPINPGGRVATGLIKQGLNFSSFAGNRGYSITHPESRTQYGGGKSSWATMGCLGCSNLLTYVIVLLIVLMVAWLPLMMGGQADMAVVGILADEKNSAYPSVRQALDAKIRQCEGGFQFLNGCGGVQATQILVQGAQTASLNTQVGLLNTEIEAKNKDLREAKSKQARIDAEISNLKGINAGQLTKLSTAQAEIRNLLEKNQATAQERADALADAGRRQEELQAQIDTLKSEAVSLGHTNSLLQKTNTAMVQTAGRAIDSARNSKAVLGATTAIIANWNNPGQAVRLVNATQISPTRTTCTTCPMYTRLSQINAALRGRPNNVPSNVILTHPPSMLQYIFGVRIERRSGRDVVTGPFATSKVLMGMAGQIATMNKRNPIVPVLTELALRAQAPDTKTPKLDGLLVQAKVPPNQYEQTKNKMWRAITDTIGNPGIAIRNEVHQPLSATALSMWATNIPTNLNALRSNPEWHKLSLTQKLSVVTEVSRRWKRDSKTTGFLALFIVNPWAVLMSVDNVIIDHDHHSRVEAMINRLAFDDPTKIVEVCSHHTDQRELNAAWWSGFRWGAGGGLTTGLVSGIAGAGWLLGGVPATLNAAVKAFGDLKTTAGDSTQLSTNLHDLFHELQAYTGQQIPRATKMLGNLAAAQQTHVDIEFHVSALAEQISTFEQDPANQGIMEERSIQALFLKAKLGMQMITDIFEGAVATSPAGQAALV